MKTYKIIVTGATGFVGSHLVEELISQKAEVIATTHHPIIPKSYFAVQKLEKKCQVIKIELANFSRVQRLIAKVKPQFIFHLAAQPLVDVAYDDPKDTLYSNILGTINVLESARLSRGIKGLIVASSDKAYGKMKKSNREEDLLFEHSHGLEPNESRHCGTNWSEFGRCAKKTFRQLI